MEHSRRGERIGWTGGWLGSFLWVLIFGVLRLVQGRLLEGMAGGLGFFLALILVQTLAPWRHPETRYWKLMGPLYLWLLACVAAILVHGGGPGAAGLSAWSLFLLLPVLMPLFQMGARRWKDDGTP